MSQPPPHTADRAALLSALGIMPDEVVCAEPLTGGLSGSRITRLTLARRRPGGATFYASRILKELRPRDGWLGILSNDQVMRELVLRERNVLERLPRTVATATVGGARLGTPPRAQRGALLLRDERGHLLRDPLRTPPGRLPPVVAFIVDRLAHMHARFWNDSRLTDPSLGLVSAEDTLLLYAPDRIAARIVEADPAAYLPLAAAGWQAFLRIASPDAAATLRQVFAAPQPWVDAASNLPFTLVHGDVWGPNLGVLLPTRVVPRLGTRLLLLDWALVNVGPATYDPLSLCGAWHALDPVRLLAAYRARLTRHLGARGIRLSPATWLALVDAGYLRTALTCGEAFGRAAAVAPAGLLRQRAERRVRWWARRGMLAAHRLHTSPSLEPAKRDLAVG